jgi:hypothetical protein
MARTAGVLLLKLAFLLSVLLAAPAYAGDGSAPYGPLDSQSGSLVDATPGTKRADQRSPCERLKGKAKQSCLKKKPGELAASPGKASRSDAARGASR